MKKIGFGGVAEATTWKGDATLAPAVGPDTVKGKSLVPVPQAAVDGLAAVGAGKLPVLAVHVMGTGGVDGNEGAGLGVGVGVGVGVVVMVFELEPQPASIRLRTTKMDVPYNARKLRTGSERKTAP